MHIRASSDRHDTQPSTTTDGSSPFRRGKQRQGVIRRPSRKFSTSEAIRTVLAGKIASKARAYGWNAWERGSVSVPTVGVCPKNLQSADDCLNCWQVVASPLHQQE